MKINIASMLFTVFLPSIALSQGVLTPSGAPAPTMKSLDQIEPRIDVLKLSGDGANLIKIDRPGSYYLSTNIIGVAGKNGILIETNNVTLDLNGFSLLGTTGNVNGIFVISAQKSISVRNGIISDWGGSGVSFINCQNVQFQNLQVFNNGAGGLTLGSRALVQDCISSSNALSGIEVGDSSIVLRCEMNANLHGLLTTGNGIVAQDCLASSNRSSGILLNDGAVAAQCTANGNTTNGISVRDFSVVKGSVTFGNGSNGIVGRGSNQIIDCNAGGNGADGIQVSAGSLVKECTANGNGTTLTNGSGIHALSIHCRIEGNMVRGNDIGIKDDAGQQLIIRNSAANNTVTNFSLMGANMFGTLSTLTTFSTNQNPHANFALP
jgi:hypothetical protein